MPNLTTRLEALNVILGTIGESPVNSVIGATADAASALAVLDEVSREVQSSGWHFNTENSVVLRRDSKNEIPLGQNVLRVTVPAGAAGSTQTPTQRGPRLFNRETHTYTFSADVTATIVYLLAFEELPEPARRYITVRAARTYQDRFVGSEQLTSFTLRDEQLALYALQEADGDVQQLTFFDNTPSFNILSRK